MAYRFGRSHWQDSDRLNLLQVCQEHSTWNARLAAMREIYSTANYPPGYFTENSCREELERIMALPTPNLRLESSTFVFSRKIMMGKWIEHYKTEVHKQKESQAEMGLVTIRANVEMMKEALDPNVTEERLEELMQIAQQYVDRNKNDVNFKRIVGSLDAALTERLEKEKTLDLSALELPPTKPPGEDAITGSRGFLTPTHSTPAPDMSFFSPEKVSPFKMTSMAQAVREAAPIILPPPEFVEPAPPPQIIEDLPDDIMEPDAPSPVKVPKKEEEPEKEKKAVTPQQSPKKSVIAASPKTISQPTTPSKSSQRTPQKKREPSPMEVKIEEIKEEEDASTPPASPSVSTTPVPRSRGRPRIHSSSSSLANSAKKNEKVVTPRTDSPDVEPPPKKKTKETSQEPVSSKRIRTQTIAPMTTRRRKEDTPSNRLSSVPPVIRSDSGLDFGTAPGSPMDAQPTREIEVQTDITIRQIVQDISIGERRRSNVPPPSFRKSRKSFMPTESARSVSRNSSASTPAPRGSSVVGTSTRSVGCQTNVRFDIEKDELVVMRVDSHPIYFPTYVDLDNRKPIVVSFETCKEISAENAALGENSVDMGKRAAKVDGKREMTFIVDSDNAIGQRLIEEKSYQLVSATCDLPSAGPNDSPVKRRREDRTREDNMKTQLLTMYRAIYDCEWSEAFKKPVPPAEATYDEGIFERIDLSMIKKEIENGQITSVTGFLLRAYRMLSNAVMYNGWDHDVHIHAKNIVEHVMSDITSLIQDDNGVSSRRGHQNDPTDTDSRSISMEPEPMSPIGNAGTKRVVFRKDPNVEGIMSASGSRKGKKSTK